MKHSDKSSLMGNGKLAFRKQTLHGRTIRGLIFRQHGRKIREAFHVIGESEITYLRCTHCVVIVGSIVCRQEMLKLYQIESLYNLVVAQLRKYVLFCLCISIKVYLLSADESESFPDAYICRGELR